MSTLGGPGKKRQILGSPSKKVWLIRMNTWNLIGMVYVVGNFTSTGDSCDMSDHQHRLLNICL